MPFRGNTGEAFQLAEAALTAIGFRLTERTADSLELVGPGMNSTKQNPLVGASRIHVRGGSGKLDLDADLGGVAWLSRFVLVFPMGLVLGLGVVFTVVFGVLFGLGMWLAAVWGALGANAVMWLLLGPWMARRIRARTERALDSLLANLVSVGEAAEPRPGPISGDGA